ncbi:GNAT family N-acetyltransferase [Azospirillum sp. TSO22-1]|uniref:GNAT family N-acetyltransferase n=1 Tax=Azospirillum sp. TSO22-1 TaxID=716789 RepID=UPI000D64B68C|nr:GNAT family N-acetyltransferase [Azospirillum sp. TSO22-1]
MAPTELDAALLPGCLALSAEAGWNQTAEDWSVFFGRGTVFGVVEDGRPVATGAVLPYDGGFGWISMVLVTPARRGRRLGTRILEIGLEELARLGRVPVLDATPAGERVYRPLGFRPQFGLTRWQGPSGGGVPAGVRAMSMHDVAAAVAADALAFGAERALLLGGFLGRAPEHAFVLENGVGFVLARPGRVALQIGPLVAEREEDAWLLLEAAVGRATGPVFLDLADRWESLAAWLQERGFVKQRSFLRMAHGRDTPFGDPSRLFVAAGPEFG